jgi:hypothetical protein
VSKAFVRLRSGLPAVTPDRQAAYAAAAAQQYHTFRGVPEEAWPIFLSAKQYLHMLDGTLRKPFFRRHPDGSFLYESGGRGGRLRPPCWSHQYCILKQRLVA